MLQRLGSARIFIDQNSPRFSPCVPEWRKGLCFGKISVDPNHSNTFLPSEPLRNFFYECFKTRVN